MIGIIDSCANVISFTNRTTNRDSKRREVTLIDEDTSISITLWDEQVRRSKYIGRQLIFWILGGEFR